MRVIDVFGNFNLLLKKNKIKITLLDRVNDKMLN